MESDFVEIGTYLRGQSRGTGIFSCDIDGFYLASAAIAKMAHPKIKLTGERSRSVIKVCMDPECGCAFLKREQTRAQEGKLI